MVATARGVLTLEPDGTRALWSHGSEGVTAVTATATGWLVLGYREGSLEALARPGSAGDPPPAFDQVQASPVLVLAAGPRNTVVAGHADGQLSLRSLEDGALLRSQRLHGRVVHLLMGERHLHAATDLGDHATWDLQTLHISRCELLHRIWRAVPVVWEHGNPTFRPPPEHHPCRAGKRQ